jgi:hypothetical protein
MSKEVTVMNWFFGILGGLLVLLVISSLVYAKVKKEKIDRLPVFVILLVGYAGCATAIMNLRERHEKLAIALTVVELILVAVSAPVALKRFIKHLRDEGLIANKRVD